MSATRKVPTAVPSDRHSSPSVAGPGGAAAGGPAAPPRLAVVGGAVGPEVEEAPDGGQLLRGRALVEAGVEVLEQPVPRGRAVGPPQLEPLGGAADPGEVHDPVH